MSAAIRVLHIGNEMNWRGGENQVRLLIENSPKHVAHFVAYPKGSLGIERFQKICPTLAFSGKKINWAAVREIADFVKKHQIQILDAQSSGGHDFAVAVSYLIKGLKIVIHRRVDNEIKKGFWTKFKYRSNRVNLFVPISNCIEKMLIDYGIPKEKISLVRSSIDTRPYRQLVADKSRIQNVVRRRLNVPENTVLMGNASAFTEQKGYDVLVEAMPALIQSHPNVYFLFAGDGPDKPAIEQAIAKHNLQKHVSFLGHITNVPEFLVSLQVLVFPSRNEGLGTLLLEAAHAGCAVIATNVGGIPEIIKDQKTGLLTPAGDVNALTQAMNEMVSKPELRQQTSAQLRLHVEKDFSLQNMVAGNIKNYEKLMS